jgi:hypothetical protein
LTNSLFTTPLIIQSDTSIHKEPSDSQHCGHQWTNKPNQGTNFGQNLRNHPQVNLAREPQWSLTLHLKCKRVYF